MPDTQNEDLQLLVSRNDWSQTRFESAPLDPLTRNQVRYRIDRFALTSNNISYASAGDMLGYWDFFPAEEGWGRIPAMGFADVVESEHPDVAVGERVFGFFPMARYLTIDAEGMTPGHYVDGAAHRRNHAPVYRQYSRVLEDPLYDEERENQILLMRGLFMTSFLVDGFLADHSGFGAESYILGSASSKTSIALAFLLAGRGAGRVIGITGDRNREFVEKLGFYDEVRGYDEAAALPADRPTSFIDFSGHGAFIRALHEHLRENLKNHCIVGATHWTAGEAATNLPGAEPTFFFAPGEIKNRIDAWGADEFQKRILKGWTHFCASSDDWLNVCLSSGRTDLERVYAEVLEGRAQPRDGHVLSLSREA